MKSTLKLLAMTAAVAGMGFLTSCGDKKDEVTPSGTATISLVDVSGDNGITITNKQGDLDFAAGDTVRVKIRTSGAARFQVFAGNAANTTNSITTEITKASGDTTIQYVLGSTPTLSNGNFLKFRIRTTAGRDSLVLKLNEAHNVYTSTILVAPTADNSSLTFVNFVTGARYTVLQAAATPANADAGLFIGGSTNRFAMFSLDNWSTETTYYGDRIGTSGSTWNKTRFRIPAITADPAKWASTATVASLYNNGGSGTNSTTAAYIYGETPQENDGQNSNVADRANSRVGNLQQGSTFAFRTQAGKLGLARVIRLTRNGAAANRAGEIEITYRVQR